MRRKRVFLYIFLGICALALFSLSRSSAFWLGNVRKDPQKGFKNYMKFNHVNGVILVSDKKGRPIVIKNNETSKKDQTVKANQLFPIASLQKIMTGTAVYQLEQKSQLNLNTPLAKYYPKVPGSKNITIRELMNHTSGLVNNDRPAEPLKTQNQQIAYMLKHITYDHLHTWDYQDVDYELLAAIISQESNMTYNNYIQNSFAKPFHLSQVKDFSEVKQREIPQPIGKNINWHKVTVTTSSDFGAGNLFMSPLDYWKFVYNRVLKDPKMINKYSQQAQSQEVKYFGGVYFKGNIIKAEGSIPGYNCCFVANYKTKQMVMFFSNNINYFNLRKASEYILHDYMGVERL